MLIININHIYAINEYLLAHYTRGTNINLLIK